MIGQKIFHYQILKRLGGGGMGVVYEAEDTRLGRRVAVKFLPEELPASGEALERFRREARAASALNHPHICTIYDVGEHEGRPFLVMERLEGRTLKHKIGGKPLAIDEVLELGVQVAGALEAAHAAGIVHRDVKPANIFVAERGQAAGWAKLLDFGLVKLEEAVSSGSSETVTLGEELTRTGSAIGTVAYMSPEQARGEKVDARSDLFSLGVVLYEMATGRLPFTGGSPAAVFSAILTRALERPSLYNPQIPPELDRIILASLEKDPRLRTQNASAIRSELERLKRDAGPPERASATSSSDALPARRRLRTGLGALAAVAVVSLAFWLGRGIRPSEPVAKVMPSVAVLPFLDLSPEKDQEYFADGLSEELLNVLAKNGGLRVAARTSSFFFKGKSPEVAEVAEKLNVSAILEGSVRKAGDRLRITAQLVNATDGFHLWTQTYDRRLDDVFAVQDEIARSVAEALDVKLVGGGTPQASRGTSVEAYNAYLQGRYFAQRYTEQDTRRALGYFQEAVALDAAYAPAWAGLSWAYTTLSARIGGEPLDEGMARARQAAQRALELDEGLPEAHIALAAVQSLYDWDWDGSEASVQRALELDPNNVMVLSVAAMVKFNRGRSRNEALELIRRGLELDPLNQQMHRLYGYCALALGHLDEATTALRKAQELLPEMGADHFRLGCVLLAQSRPQEALREMEQESVPTYRLQGLALAYHALGQREKSDEALAELIERFWKDWSFQIAEVYAYRGETDEALEWLEQAYERHDAGIATLPANPFLSSLENDPRYAAFREKIGLVD